MSAKVKRKSGVFNKTAPSRPVKRQFFLYSEEDVNKAIQAVSSGVSVKRAALDFNVPRSSLRRRLQKASEKRKMGPSTILTADEEMVLEKWVTGLCRKGFLVRKQMLLNAVKKILDMTTRKTPFKDNMPGETWFKSFLRRHPNAARKQAESLTKSTSAVTKQRILSWFEDVESYLKEEKISDILKHPERIYIADETGFFLCPKTGRILEPRTEENVYCKVPNNKEEQITVLTCFSANGKTVPPMVIYPYKHLPRDAVNSVTSNWSVGFSDNGWINSDIFFVYISNHFNNYLTNNNSERPIIMFVDGHHSHLTPEISDFCTENQIILIALHRKDVSIFRPLKSGWKEITRKWQFDNYPDEITNKTFAPFLKEMFEKNATVNMIKNGFKTCGLFPFNPININFNQCASHKEIQNASEVENTRFSIDMSEHIFLKTLERKINSALLEQFKNIPNDQEWSGEEAAKHLFYLWRKCKMAVTLDNSSTKLCTTSLGPSQNDTHAPHCYQSYTQSSTSEALENSNILSLSSKTPKYSSFRNSEIEKSFPASSSGFSQNKADFITCYKAPIQETLSQKNAAANPDLKINNPAIPLPLSRALKKYEPCKDGKLLSSFKKCVFWPKTPEKKTSRSKVIFPAVMSFSSRKKCTKEKTMKKRTKKEHQNARK